MVIGIGADLTDIRRIERSLKRYGDRFLKRILTSAEQELAKRREMSDGLARTVSTRFAAKEACSKALGVGIAEGIGFQTIEVISGDLGQPRLQLYGKAAERLEFLTPARHTARLHLTLTDADPWAFAQVVIDAVPTA